MQRCVVFFGIILMAFGFSSLSAQAVAPYQVVTGPVLSLSAIPSDLQAEVNEFYSAMLAELQWQGRLNNTFQVHEAIILPGIPVRESLPNVNARYVITGTVSGSEEKIFSIRLWNPDDTANPIVSNSVAYKNKEEILELMPYLVWQLVSVMPVVLPPVIIAAPEPKTVVEDPSAKQPSAKEPSEEPSGELVIEQEAPPPEKAPDMDDYTWKNYWLYLSLQGGLSVRFYTFPDMEPAVGLAFLPAIHAEFQLFAWHWPYNYFSISMGTGISLSMDKAVYKDRAVASYSMSVPLVLKVNFKPHQFIISPFGGMYYVFPIAGSAPYTPPLGYTVGIEGGIHLGPGVLYIGLQFDSDIGWTKFLADQDELSFRRKIFSVSVGYSFGMIQRTIRETL